MEGFETSRFKRAASRLFHVNMRITRTTAVLPPLMEAVGGVAMVGALFYGSHAIRSGRLTTGAFAAFALLAMYTPLKRLSRLNATLQGALAAGTGSSRCWTPTSRSTSGTTPATSRACSARSNTRTWPSASRMATATC